MLENRLSPVIKFPLQLVPTVLVVPQNDRGVHTLRKLFYAYTFLLLVSSPLRVCRFSGITRSSRAVCGTITTSVYKPRHTTTLISRRQLQADCSNLASKINYALRHTILTNIFNTSTNLYITTNQTGGLSYFL